jgi:N-acetylglutamate synthase-like GNAT family acetyltransferase
MRIHIVYPRSTYYERALMFRWEMLSKPLGQPPGSQREPWEDKSLHLVAIEGREIVGCVLLYPESKEMALLTQLALCERPRERAYGKKMIRRLESVVETMGIKQILLEATSEWISLFIKLGYRLIGEPVIREGAYYHCMSKICCS